MNILKLIIYALLILSGIIKLINMYIDKKNGIPHKIKYIEHITLVLITILFVVVLFI